MDTTATTTPATMNDLMEQAAVVAAKLARVAIRNGADEASAIDIGKTVLIEWIQADGEMSTGTANARAAHLGRRAAGR